MYGQPDGQLVRRRPFDPVAFVRRDVYEITGLHFNRKFVALEAKSCCPFQHDDPLMLILIESEAIGRCVAVRDAPFDADVGGIEDRREKLSGKVRWEAEKEIGFHRVTSPSSFPSSPSSHQTLRDRTAPAIPAILRAAHAWDR